MPSNITIAVPFVRNACVGARRAGYDVDSQLRACAIPPELLQRDRSRVPVDSFIALLRRLMRLMDDECLGLVGEPMRVGCFALAARSALHEKTLIAAMHAFIRGMNLTSSQFVMEFLASGDELKINLRRRKETRVYSNYIIESSLMTAHRFFCWLGRVRLPVELAELDYPAPDYAAEYRYLFYGAPVKFNAEQACLRLAGIADNTPVRRNLSELEAYIAAAPSEIFTPLTARQVSQRARQIILDWLERKKTMPTSQQCAEELTMAGQSFWRRLHREGIDYRTLRSEVRRDLAIKLLRDDEIPIESIAARTGYSESSAFIRAFRQWTGLTPLAYRKLSR